MAPFLSADASRSAGASPRDPSAMQPPASAAAAAAGGAAGAGDPAAADRAEAAAAAPAPVSLEMENARLRAELATQVCCTLKCHVHACNRMDEFGGMLLRSPLQTGLVRQQVIGLYKAALHSSAERDCMDCRWQSHAWLSRSALPLAATPAACGPLRGAACHISMSSKACSSQASVQCRAARTFDHLLPSNADQVHCFNSWGHATLSG